MKKVNVQKQKFRKEVRKASKELIKAMSKMALIRATHPELVGCYSDGRHQYFWPINDWLKYNACFLWNFNWLECEPIDKKVMAPIIAYLISSVKHIERWMGDESGIRPDKSWAECCAAVEYINDNNWAAPRDDEFFEALRCLG